MKALAFAFLALLISNQASALPSCKEQWKNQKHQFDFQEEYSDFQSRLQRSQCEKDWTVLVYMAADNDLNPYALMDLYEMESAFESDKGAGSTLKADLIVQADGPSSNDLRRLHIFAGPVKYESKTKEDFAQSSFDDVKSPVVEKLREGNSPEKEKLAEFLKWGAKNYPAKHYFVVVWGHGQGWKSYPVKNPAKSRFLDKNDLPDFPEASNDKDFGGIAFRQSSNSWLDIPGLKYALDSFGRKNDIVDVYASDACLMQMLEVSYELSASARFIVGSAQVQNFLGLPYRRIMYELNTGRFNGQRKKASGGEDAKDEPYLLAKMIPELMKQSLNSKRGLQGRGDRESQKFVTSSSLTSQELQRSLIPEMKRLAHALKNYLLEDPLRSIDIQFVLQSTPAFEGGAQDFGVFLGMLDFLLIEESKKNDGYSPAANALREEVRETKNILNESILSYVYGSAYPQDQNSRIVGFIPRAVSLWLPVSPEEYQKRKLEFAASQLYQDTDWQEWLDLLLR